MCDRYGDLPPDPSPKPNPTRRVSECCVLYQSSRSNPSSQLPHYTRSTRLSQSPRSNSTGRASADVSCGESSLLVRHRGGSRQSKERELLRPFGAGLVNESPKWLVMSCWRAKVLASNDTASVSQAG